MAEPVLVVTPSAGFGELIRLTLRESGYNQVAVVQSGEEAVRYASAKPFSLAIVDADLTDLSLIDLRRHLNASQPDARWILVLPEQGLDRAERADLSPDGYLNKPFYLPSLLSTVEKVLEGRGGASRGESSRPESEGPEAGRAGALPPPWLRDVSRAAQHLTRLTLESAAQAALITRRDEVWAYAGELPQPAAAELAKAVADYWSHDGGSDMARFVRLQATGGEYVVYATALAGDLVLSLVFDAKTPFSKIRAQAAELAHSLAHLPNGERLPVGVEAPSPSEDEPREVSLGPLLEDVPAPSPPDRQPTIPPPGPTLSGSKLEAAQQRESRQGAHQQAASELTSEPSQKDISSRELDPGIWEPEYPSLPRDESQLATMRENLQSPTLPQLYPALHQLSYVCLLVARMPQHYLTGDLASRLAEWLPQTCLAFGWRLEHLTIRPGYLQWIVNTPPETSPEEVVETIRYMTSQRIFDEFPRLKQQNPSNDFWAPGFLIMSSAQPLAGQIIVDFIQRTRAWQGATDQE